MNLVAQFYNNRYCGGASLNVLGINSERAG